MMGLVTGLADRRERRKRDQACNLTRVCKNCCCSSQGPSFVIEPVPLNSSGLLY